MLVDTITRRDKAYSNAHSFPNRGRTEHVFNVFYTNIAMLRSTACNAGPTQRILETICHNVRQAPTSM
jgi:hypothetical protein